MNVEKFSFISCDDFDFCDYNDNHHNDYVDDDALKYDDVNEDEIFVNKLIIIGKLLKPW